MKKSDSNYIIILSAVALILIGLFFLPHPLKKGFVLDTENPTIETAFISNYIHLTLEHLCGNLISYALISIFLLFLWSQLGYKNLNKNLILIFLVFPIINSLACVIVFQEIIQKQMFANGFSAIVSALFGFLPYSIILYLKKVHKVDFNKSLLFIFLFSTILIVPIFYFNTFLLFIVILALAFSLKETSKDFTNIFSSLSKKLRTKILFFISVSIFISFLFSLSMFPKSITYKEGVVNIFSHYLGYIFGFTLGLAKYIYDDKK